MRKLSIGLALLLLAVAALVLVTLVRAGQFRSIEPLIPGECTVIEGVVGAEDLTVDHARGLAWISADDRRATMAGAPARGQLLTMDLTATEPRLVELTPAEPADFHPHGLSLWTGPDGRQRLFVINHPVGGGHVVEIFDLTEAGGLVHAESVTHPAMSRPNDLVAAGPRQFYLGNDHRHDSGLLHHIETLLALPWSGVIFFDGEGAWEVASGLAYTNGMQLSPDGRTLWVVETTGKALHRYLRDPDSGGLTPDGSWDLGSGLDNVEWDEQGRLLITAHPRLLDFSAHASDARERSPTQVIRVEPGEPGGFETIYMEPGELLSGGSVAAVYRGRMLMGSVFEPWLLLCDLPDASSPAPAGPR